MTMKKILFALLTGWMAISFTACDDFLTETPSTSVPTPFPKSCVILQQN